MNNFIHEDCIADLSICDGLIEWSLNDGLNDPEVSDYLTPLKNWLEKNRKEMKPEISTND